MLRQQHFISTDEWMSLRNSPFLWRKMDSSNRVGGTWSSNLMTNALPFEVWTIRTRCFLPHVFFFNTDWWWMDVVTKMPHFRWFQSRTLGFMPNALPFEVDSTYPCARQNKESRTQCHNWPWNQLFVIQFCTSYRYLIIRSQVCTLFGNMVILLWVKVRTNCIIRTGITANKLNS